MSLTRLDLMRKIRWRDPEGTKPPTSRWHRNHEAMAEWYSRWWIELTIPGPAPEELYFIDDLMMMIEVPRLVYTVPEQ